MQRFSVSVDEDLAEWIEERADQRGVSKAKVIRDAIAAARDIDTDLVQPGELVSRLNELESRVDALEQTREEVVGDELAAAVADHRDLDVSVEDEDDDEAEDVVQTPSDSPHGANTESLDEHVKTYLEDHPPQSEAAEAAILTAWKRLREVEVAKTGELREFVYERHSEAYADENSLWQSLQRYFEDLPGIEKGGYGEWEYAGDGVAREELSE